MENRDSFHLDYETSSKVDISKFGAYRYASDESTKILMFSICRNQEPALVWDSQNPDSPESAEALALLKEAVLFGGLIYAWNAPFELAICHYQLEKQLGIPAPDLEDYRCVAAMARRAAMPNALGKCAEELQIPQQKQKVGKLLINIFSDRNKTVTLSPPPGAKDYSASETGRKFKNRKSDSPVHGWQDKDVHHDEILWDWSVKVDGDSLTVREAWDLFLEYCRKDTVVEEMLHSKLSHFELKGDILASFQFNLRMNHRGVPVNLNALRNAQKIVEVYQQRVTKKFEKLTDGLKYRSPRFKDWLMKRGYYRENLQADTVSDALEEDRELLTSEAYQALEYKKLLSFAALAKIPAMIGAACPDGTVKGTMQWHTARTGRAGGRIIQPQNMKKALGDICSELCYLMLCEGCTLGDIEEMWDSPLDAIASSCRHFIHSFDNDLLDADYTGVEARITPWLANDVEKLDSVLAGEDQYIKAVSDGKVYPESYETIMSWRKSDNPKLRSKANEMRTVGKPLELSCCFGTGGRGIRNSLRDTYGIFKSLAECNKIVKTYRTDRYPTVDAWDEIEKAFIAAIKGKTSKILGGKVRVGRIATAGIAYVVMKLPSGRNLYYPRAHTKMVFKKYDKEELVEEPWKKDPKNWSVKHKAYGYWADEIRFWGSKDGKPFNWVPTWGSRLFENLVQSIGADLLDHGCISAEAAGHDIFMVVHDQALSPHRDHGIKHFIKHFTKKQPWAETFPLEADGDVAPFYRKDD